MITVMLRKRLPYERPVTAAKLPPPVLHADGKLTICLPIPPQAISPNASRGQSKIAAIMKSRKVKGNKTLARLVLGSALVDFGIREPAFAGYALAFHFRTAHHRDDDNADACCKAYRDGMAAALGIDDRSFRKLALSTHATDPQCPRVEVTLWPAMTPKP